METSESKLLNLIELCLLRKLSKNFDECENQAEYEHRKTNLYKNIHNLLHFLEQTKCEDFQLTPRVLASLLILFLELKSDGIWNTEKSKQYSDKLNQHFSILYEVSLENLLQKSCAYNTQDIFEACIASMCVKLNSKDLKKYPSLIEVYCTLFMNIQELNVRVNPLTSLPIPLLLIDDYLIAYKIKGLKCCTSILKCLSPEDFADGNFYEVLYESLRKTMLEKDIEITNLMCVCLLEFIRIVPQRAKENRISEIYSTILEQLNTESNLYRKALLFKLTKNVIPLCGVNCVKKKTQFKLIIGDNLEVSCTEAIGDILLQNVLECLTEWLRYSWCVWKFSQDHKLLAILLKVLYACKEEYTQVLVNIINTLIGLSSPEEQQQVMKSLNKSSQIKNDLFQQRIQLIKVPMDI